MKKKIFKLVARTLIVAFSYQLIFPACAYALTTGPSQPEVQSFEPVGTTEMVDMFTGDFNYNIPLMDVEGYPINIFYHSGIGIEQEASWVGLGWNINPGEINRSVRGLPDDFNGEKIEKYSKIKPEKDVRIGIGANINLEIVGKDLKALTKSTKNPKTPKVSLGAGYYVNYNNYRGMSAGITTSAGVKIQGVSFGINMGIGSQSGADIDWNANASTSKAFEKGSGGMGVQGGVGGGFNSRSGLKDISLTVSPYTYQTKEYKDKTPKSNKVQTHTVGTEGLRFNSPIPIGLQNYVPVITNQISQTALALQVKVGTELWSTFPAFYVDAMVSDVSYDPEGSRNAYGFMYAENASPESIMDFSRDNDGQYNKTVKNLPIGANTYDVYSVNGQGVGGMFRPFRNDLGTIYDPYVAPKTNINANVRLEFGIGDIFEAGGDATITTTNNESGPWSMLKYGGNAPGTLYEKIFYKQGGDLSYNQQQEVPQLFNHAAEYLMPNLQNLVSHNYRPSGNLPNKYKTGENDTRIYWDNTNLDRSSRSNYIAYQTAEQMQTMPETEESKKIVSYENGTANNFYDPKLKQYDRYISSAGKWGTTALNAKPHQISQFTQTTADGRRYVYGIPAMNNATREATFAIDESRANLENGYVGFNRGSEDGSGNTMGRDNFYSTTNTPAYAHSYLLTNVLSNDYVDIMGDGPTDDDLGAFTKINYTLTDKDYRWRTPYPKDSAQYNPGFWSDSKDGRGNYIIGSRQQWYVRSIETKNYVAEFYTSKRKDALGVQDSILQKYSNITAPGINLQAKKTDSSFSYKLDSIKLYNKHDRYINKDNAVPIKTVVLQYDYSLCPNTPNSVADTKGKLTLKKIFIKYGNSQKNLLSPYSFEYNTQNYPYNFAAKDRWGNYKEVKSGVHNYEFPYTQQPNNTTEETQLNNQVTAWNMTDIKLPSGGKIHVDYESDDYSFVQDRRAMQMLTVEGVGNSKAFERKNRLYIDEKNINDFVYFKRRKNKERLGLSMRENYLENQELIKYDFNIDILGNGTYEYLKGYARFKDIGVCTNNDDYGYIELQREQVKKLNLHPATVLGINTGRYYLPHLFYPGYEEKTDVAKIFKGLIGAGQEMINTLLLQNPFRRFINQGKARVLNLDKSSLRLQTPCLTKKGGGIRVKQLTLSDNWNTMSGNQDASYGKKYDYTIPDNRYGLISSGVATYEPMIGGDENPLKNPVPYSADKGRLLPSIDFFQEEPFGETFYPGASVGYSSVKVSSIHQQYGRSAQALDEYLYYTAKDFPVKVDYTQIGGGKPKSIRTFTTYTNEATVFQGYAIILNDMHGKPKAVNNYVINTDGTNAQTQKITGVTYNYFKDKNDKDLDNTVTALTRKRGTVNQYELKQVKLGEDIDFSIDSRQRNNTTTSVSVDLNLNTFQVFGIPIFPFTIFGTYKERNVDFKSLVSTKVVQQYGILKSIESFDHGAVTTTQNLVFDGETGGVLLSRTSNKFNDFSYTRKDPAYLAYEGMMPAYTNDGYEETADSLVVDELRDGYLYTNHIERYTAGDELLVDLKSGSLTDRADDANSFMKLWVLGVARQHTKEQTGNVTFWKPTSPISCSGDAFNAIAGAVSISIKDATATVVKTGTLNDFYANANKLDHPTCDDEDCLRFFLPTGTYTYTASGSGIGGSTTSTSTTFSGSFTITAGQALNIALFNYWNGILITQDCPVITDPCFGSNEDTTRPCGLLVAPRYKNLKDPITSANISKWPQTRALYRTLPVKIVRSGRRNNLDKSVQETVFSAPASTSPSAFISNIYDYMNKKDHILATSVNTYTDTAQNYRPFVNAMNNFGLFNDFVLGLRGNYRPYAAYTPLTNRAYDKAHERYDGTYTIDNLFWNFQNAYTYTGDGAAPCNIPKTVLNRNNLTGTLLWKNAATITRYDPNGNAVEERDAIGNYSAAQYGYNRQLPVAVASNVQAQHFMFEGFEEYNMLLPQVNALLYNAMNRSSSLATLFAQPLSSIIADYPSEQATGDNAVFSRYGQRYYLMNKNKFSGLELTNTANHTGFYCLKTTAAKGITFPIAPNRKGSLMPFTLMPNQNYTLSFWAKSASTTSAMSATTCSAEINNGTTTPPSLSLALKTSSIDGWYLIEAKVDLKSITTGTPFSLVLKLPSGIYIDDIRLIPINANMKSFVYDPISFKLMAQLDENHFATFFEYDQEGLLVRTKKETARGIVTISESRRANAK